MEDIWPLILENLEIKNIVALSLINKSLLHIIKTHPWQIEVFIKNINFNKNNIKFVINLILTYQNVWVWF
jgi:hypothetical protein